MENKIPVQRKTNLYNQITAVLLNTKEINAFEYFAFSSIHLIEIYLAAQQQRYSP